MKEQANSFKKSSIHRNKMNQQNNKSVFSSKKDPEINPNLMTKLKNIAQVTEDDYTHRIHQEQAQTESISLINENQKFQSLWKKGFKCIKKLLCCVNDGRKLQIQVDDDCFVKKISQLREVGIQIGPFLPHQKDKQRKTLVLDLDHTLIHPSISKPTRYDFSFELPFKNKTHQIYCKNRFGLDSFLFQMSQIYQLVLYSSGTPIYVDSILANIDKKGRIKYRLYRDKCIKINKIYFLKSLKLLGRKQDSVLFIDNNPASGVLQPSNFLQIKPFKGENHDRQLVKLIPFLKSLANEQILTPVNKKYEEFYNIEIDLKFHSFDLEHQQNRKKLQEVEIGEQDKENTYMGLHQIKKQVEDKMSNVDKKIKYGHVRSTSETESFAQQQQVGMGETEEESCKTEQNFVKRLKVKDTNI